MKLQASYVVLAICAEMAVALGPYDRAICDNSPDPHIRTWDNIYYDYHGAADLIACQGDVIDVHMQTVPHGGWSGISKVAVHIHADNVTLEVLTNFTDGGYCCNEDCCDFGCCEDLHAGVNNFNDKPEPCCPPGCCDEYQPVTRNLMGGTSTYLIDGVHPATPPPTVGSYGFVVTASTYELLPGGSQKITIYDYGTSGLRLLMDLHGSVAYTCTGTCGDWQNGGVRNREGGLIIGGTSRSLATVPGFENEEVGAVWQVKPDDPVYFTEPKGSPPEYFPKELNPELIPKELNPELKQEATQACAEVEQEEARDACVFDILLTGDLEWAENPRYKDPEPQPANGEPECRRTGFICRLLNGKCVYRCDPSENLCLRRLCREASLRTGSFFFGGRDDGDFVEGCSCALRRWFK